MSKWLKVRFQPRPQVSFHAERELRRTIFSAEEVVHSGNVYDVTCTTKKLLSTENLSRRSAKYPGGGGANLASLTIGWGDCKGRVQYRVESTFKPLKSVHLSLNVTTLSSSFISLHLSSNAYFVVIKVSNQQTFSCDILNIKIKRIYKNIFITSSLIHLMSLK